MGLLKKLGKSIRYSGKFAMGLMGVSGLSGGRAAQSRLGTAELLERVQHHSRLARRNLSLLRNRVEELRGHAQAVREYDRPRAAECLHHYRRLRKRVRSLIVYERNLYNIEQQLMQAHYDHQRSLRRRRQNPATRGANDIRLGSIDGLKVEVERVEKSLEAQIIETSSEQSAMDRFFS